jgi:hypothetical protein
MVYDSNSYLTLDEMKVNAQYILDFLLGKGWTKNAVCGMLGNMQSESNINFGIWEGLNSSDPTKGFGLTQWTPSTKYTDWANANGYGSDHVNGELNRILYEVANNNVQWSTDAPLTFAEFTQSNDAPENLAQDFLIYYEKPANQNQPDRQTQARYWYDNLTGGGTVTPPASDTIEPLIHMLLSDCLNGWK